MHLPQFVHLLPLALALLSPAAALPHPIPTFGPADVLIAPAIPTLPPSADLPLIPTTHHPRALRPVMATPHPPEPTFSKRQPYTTLSPGPTPTATPLSAEGAGSEGREKEEHIARDEAKNIYPGPRYTGGPKCVKREGGMLVPCGVGLQSLGPYHSPTLGKPSQTVG